VTFTIFLNFKLRKNSFLKGAQGKGSDEKNLADECIKQLDSNHDGKVTKG
jgi:hypothetical protein